MKKSKIIATVTAVALTVSLLAGCGEKEPALDPADYTLDAQECQEIALRNAGLTADQVTDLQAEFDPAGDTVHYNVSFRHEDQTYSYEIHADYGKVLSYEGPAIEQKETSPTEVRDLTAEEAQAVALRHRGLEQADVTGLTAEEGDYEGTACYLVRFTANGATYEYYIRTTDGQILFWQQDR